MNWNSTGIHWKISAKFACFLSLKISLKRPICFDVEFPETIKNPIFWYGCSLKHPLENLSTRVGDPSKEISQRWSEVHIVIEVPEMDYIQHPGILIRRSFEKIVSRIHEWEVNKNYSRWMRIICQSLKINLINPRSSWK